MKTCFKCGVRKPLGDFYRHPKMADGRLGKCRECAKVDVRSNRLKRIEFYRLYDRARSMEPKRIALARECQRSRRQDHPEKDQAYRAVRRAIRLGSLERLPCEVCGNTRSHGHHEDYSRPLDVIWLCQQHHIEAHAAATPF